MPLHSGEESFNNPAPLIATKAPTILRAPRLAIRPMRRNHLGALLLQVLVEFIAAVGAITNQVLRRRLDHIKVKTQLNQDNLMVIRGMGADREGQSLTVDNRQNFHAFPAFGRPDLAPALLRRGKVSIDKAFRHIHRRVVAQGIGQVDEDAAQPLTAALVLNPAMHRFVVLVAHWGSMCHWASAVRIHSAASRTARAGTGLRPGRLSGDFLRGSVPGSGSSGRRSDAASTFLYLGMFRCQQF